MANRSARALFPPLPINSETVTYAEDFSKRRLTYSGPGRYEDFSWKLLFFIQLVENKFYIVTVRACTRRKFSALCRLGCDRCTNFVVFHFLFNLRLG